MVQRIRGNQKTFAEVAGSMTSMVFYKVTVSIYNDVVFDVYTYVFLHI